ncbi:MAG: response regulator [Bacteroidales bacterium]|nr:response regulator [Bacteroidales bacterium]
MRKESTNIRNVKVKWEETIGIQGKFAMVADSNQKIEYISKIGKQALGLDDDSYINKICQELFCNGTHSHQNCPFNTDGRRDGVRGINTILLNGKEYNMEFRKIDVEGKHKYVHIFHEQQMTKDEGRKNTKAFKKTKDLKKDYELLFTEMGSGFALHKMIYDKDGNPKDYMFIDINPAFERLTGLHRESIIGRTVLQVMPKTEKYWIERYGDVAKYGNSVTFDEYSGEIDRYYEVKAYCPQKDYFAVIFNDITYRKKYEFELKDKNEEIAAQNEELQSMQLELMKRLEEIEAKQEELNQAKYFLDTLMDNFTEYIYFKDKQSRFVKVNKAMIDKFHMDGPEEVIGKNDFDFYADEHAIPALSDEQKVIKTGKPILDYVEREVNKDGNITWVTTSKLPLKDKMGKIIGTFGVSKDITKDYEMLLQLEESEKNLQSIFENAPFGMFLLNERLNIVKINKAGKRLANKHEKSIIGKGGGDALKCILALGNPEGCGNSEGCADCVLRNTVLKTVNIKKGLSNVEAPMKIKTKKRIQNVIYSVSTEPLYINRKQNVLLILENITLRKQTEKKIAKAREDAIKAKEAALDNIHQLKLRNADISALLEASQAVIEFDTFEITAKKLFGICKKITRAKSGYVAMLADNGDENKVLFLDSGGMKCTVDESLPMPIRGLRETAYQKRVAVVENDFSKSDWVKYLPKGHVKLKNVMFAPLIIRKKAIGLVGLANKPEPFTAHDMQMVSAIAELASIALYNANTMSDLISAKEKALESDKLKSSFLANMSHEIRTPLNGIMGFSGLMAKPGLTDEQRERYASIIKSSSEGLLRIIGDILDISRIESGDLRIDRKLFNLNEMLFDLYSLYTAKILDKGIEDIDLEYVKYNQIIQINSDEYRVRQIFVNLLDNAFKFTNKGNIKFGILKAGKSKVAFFVSDTGIGIPEEKKGLVFERFRQVEDSGLRSRGGNGLGLAIVKSLVEFLHGKISFTSEEDVGTTFHFELPINIIENEVKFKRNARSASFKKVKNTSILIVDDDPASRMFLEESLLDEGYKIESAETGRDAIQLVKNFMYDIILMDIHMPGLNGFDTIKEMRKFNRDVSIIAQTAYTLKEYKQKALKAGCEYIITKPIQLDELKGILYDVVNKPK